jgi:hypothetical protein
MLNGWATITIEWALVFLSLIFVLLRIYVRLTAPSSVRNRLSDAIIIIAGLSLATMVALDTVMSRMHIFEPGSYYDKSLIHRHARAEHNVRLLQVRGENAGARAHN